MGIINLIKKKKPLEDGGDFEKDFFSIMEFLATLGKDVKDIYELGVKVKKLRRKERSEIDDKKQKALLEEEIKAWDKFLEKFVMFDRDTDVTSERVKRISNVLKEEVEKMNLNSEVKSMVKKKDEWVFNW